MTIRHLLQRTTLDNSQNLDSDYLVTSFQLRHRSAEMHANGLLGSAKPGHIEPRE